MIRSKRAGFDDKLTLVEHLEELRTRLIVCLSALGVAFGLCFWQNGLILEILNAPLPGDREPLTLGVTEPFMTTVTVSAYAALLLVLPVVLHQAFAFVLPAFSPRHQRVAWPLLVAAPLLFFAGVAFSYFVVLPAAVKFLLNFNAGQFDIQVRAREYYGFASLALVSLGLVFQIPVAILGITRLGIVTPAQLAKNRRYAYLAIAVAAMALPGTDPITMLIEMVPLLALFEASVLVARVVERSAMNRAAADLRTEGT